MPKKIAKKESPLRDVDPEYPMVYLPCSKVFIVSPMARPTLM
jgi:hypothetical protein